jgi:predicted Zn-dependent protease
VITLPGLVQHLSHRPLGAWSVVERVQDSAFAADQPARQRRDHRTRLSLIVHVDVPRGRGSARLDIDSVDASPADLVDRAISLARASVGPAWTSAPPAAPARVDLVDPDLVERELGAVALGTLARLRRPDRLTTTAALHVLREKLTVVASSGFHTTWLATALRGDAVLASADHSLAVSRRARRGDDFDVDAALADAAADLALLDAAGPPIPGPCALWLGPEALLPAPSLFQAGPSSLGLDSAAFSADSGPDTDDPTAPAATTATDAPFAAGPAHGLWTVFAQHADSAAERRGLTRYRLHADIARGASQLPEPLSITSNGALDFAALSVPVTDDAVAIRTFPLIDRGIAVGLGLSPREAAMRNTDPNGGVRNLVVSPGTWSPAPSLTIRTIEVRRLHAVTIDPATGDATFDIALALDHRPDRPTPTPFTGGTLHLDLITALARARRSPHLLRRAAYHGPAAILIDDAELLP